MEMEQFLKTSMRNKASFCIYIGFGEWVKTANCLSSSNENKWGKGGTVSGVFNFGAVNNAWLALYTNDFTL